jgi:K+-transporting ATPase ATPase C chain
MACLVVLTVVIVCGLYPLCLWLVGQGLFNTSANGSLIVEDDTVRGSWLLAQPFNQAKYFKPRPSAVGYNAAGSGGSNLAASNPLLRDRVARQLGPMVRFASGNEAGKRVGPVVQAWFASRPGYLAAWARENPTLAQRWVKDDDNKKAVIAWLDGQPDLLDTWKKKQTPLPEQIDFDKALDDLAVPFFARFAGVHPRHWPVPRKETLPAGKTRDWLEVQEVRTVKDDRDEISDLQGVMFEPWLTAHAERAGDIEKVPADLVTASGSGLDPHISLRGARYQLTDVVAARARETGQSERAVREVINKLLDRHTFRPLAILGEPLVNVIEVNRALDAELPAKQ